MSIESLRVIYDYPSRTVLLQLGHRSHVLKNLEDRGEADKAAREYAGQFWNLDSVEQGSRQHN